MRIWKLAPINGADPIWKLWKVEPIFVRAVSEAEARRLAEMATMKFVSRQPAGTPIPINPWGGRKKIEEPDLPTWAEDVTERTNKFSVEGPAEVLHHGEGF